MPPRSRKPAEPTPAEETAGQAADNTIEDPAPTDGPAAEPQDTPKAPEGDEPPAADDTVTPPEPSDPDAAPCTECFRAGWPDEATSVGCSHGTWDRTL